jgi:hypothetical protein
MNKEKQYRDPIRFIDKTRQNRRSEIVPLYEPIKRTFLECRIQGHSSGRAGGISHQGLKIRMSNHFSQ